jgi:hypothetical protein
MGIIKLEVGVVVGLGLAGQPVNEGCVGEESILILRVAELGEQLLDILLGDLVTQVGQQVLQLSKHHGAVAVFVVQLEQLNEVVVVTLRLGSGQASVYLGDNVVELGEFLAFLISLAVGNAHLLGGVEAQGVHDVTEVVQVEFTFAIPVVDVTNLLDSIGISHCERVFCLS